MTKLSDKEKTVIADLGINTEYEQHPVQAVQDIMGILGTTVAGAKAVLRSLINKDVLEKVEGDEDDTIIQFTENGVIEAQKLNPVAEDDDELEDMDDDDMPEIEEVDFDDDEDEKPAVTMVQKAARKAAAKKDSKKSTAGATRTSHAGCEHESSKSARAKCRKERANAAKASA